MSAVGNRHAVTQTSINTQKPVDTGNLPLTGERTVPGIPAENYWFRRHEAAYEFLAPQAAGRVLLEVGCGEGYGTDLLARTAQRVLAIDYDATTLAHASNRYPSARFVRANLAALPVASGAVDVVATLQVIEHVWDHGQFIDECRRVLRPGGRLIVTTPNRLTFSPGLDAPVNPFHTKEFTAAELTGLIGARGFAVDAVLGLHAGPRLAELDARYGSFVDAQLEVAPERWSAELLDDVTSIGTADFPIHEREVDASLDLLVLAHRLV
jgi:2-polyprenyl-3-methyl-5-hydroxy-6-metoxy-1,4-benzoquinol methylase